jgi:CBS domain containing-hemolysin-like protein
MTPSWLDLILFLVGLLLAFLTSVSLYAFAVRRRRRESPLTLRLFPVLELVTLGGAVLFGVRFFESVVRVPGSAYYGLAAAVIICGVFIQLLSRNLGLRNGRAEGLRRLLMVPAILVWPVWLLIRLLGWPLLRLTGHQYCEEDPFLIGLEAPSGEIIESEAERQAREMARQLADFPEKTVKEVMVPRIDVFSLDIDTPLSEITGEITQRGHSRVPVYQETIDDILGILYVKELLQLDDPRSAEPLTPDFLHEPIFVPETKLIGTLLREFQGSKTQMAVVVDEYGGTAGIITLEDILEEIVGEIEDEFDEEQELIQPLEDGGWMIDARHDIGELNEALEVELPDEDYESLGGFIIAELGHIPSPGEVVSYENLRLEVVKATPRRVGLVRLIREDTTEELDEG